jgi:hypothetical protein
LDEELSSGQERSEGEDLNAVGWAKPAQLSSRLFYARPLLRSSTRIKLPSKAKPSAERFILNRGLAAVYSGANSIASALHLLAGRDPVENQSHFKPELLSTTSKQDISTLLGIGHFYFALTCNLLSRVLNKMHLEW